jgi:hypothetical protein
VLRLARLLRGVDAQPPPPRLVAPTVELLQGLGAASNSAALRWLLSRAAHWCALGTCS